MSSTLYAGGISNGSPSSEARPDLDETTLVLALLVLSTAGSGEIFVVRMLRDLPTVGRSTSARAGAGRVNGSCALE